MLLLFPVDGGGYFATPSAALGLTPAQVQGLVAEDANLHELVAFAAKAASEILSQISPAGSC